MDSIFKNGNRKQVSERTNGIGLQVDISTKFYIQTRTKKSKMEMFSTNMADIDKFLSVKQKMKLKTIIPQIYWDYLNMFDENKTNQLPPIRGKKINHEIELLEKGWEKPTVPWGPLYNISKDELQVLKKTLTEYLDKNFIRINNSPTATPVFLMLKNPMEVYVSVLIKKLQPNHEKKQIPFSVDL